MIKEKVINNPWLLAVGVAKYLKEDVSYHRHSILCLSQGLTLSTSSLVGSTITRWRHLVHEAPPVSILNMTSYASPRDFLTFISLVHFKGTFFNPWTTTANITNTSPHIASLFGISLKLGNCQKPFLHFILLSITWKNMICDVIATIIADALKDLIYKSNTFSLIFITYRQWPLLLHFQVSEQKLIGSLVQLHSSLHCIEKLIWCRTLNVWCVLKSRIFNLSVKVGA